MKYTVTFIFIAIIAMSCSNDDKGPILIASFDGENYRDWIQEGTAFNNGPGIESLGYFGSQNNIKTVVKSN